jgi:hypothetical protein
MKPTLLSFNEHNNAKKMIKNLYDFKKVKKCQNLVIDKIDKNYIINRCHLNSLDLLIYEENTIYNCLNIPNDDYIFNLENSFKYHH